VANVKGDGMTYLTMDRSEAVEIIGEARVRELETGLMLDAVSPGAAIVGYIGDGRFSYSF
jgi:hypothetical protein